MQRAEQPEARRGGLSPLHAFAALVGVLVAIAAVVLLTRPDPAPIPSPTTNDAPDFSLTNTEAIARFKELHALFRQGSRNRDLSVVSAVLATRSPLIEIATRDVKQLREDRVIDRSVFETKRLTVLRNEPTEIVIRQEVVITPRFILEKTGENISDSGPLKQVVEWVLVLQGSEWLVEDATVTESEPER